MFFSTSAPKRQRFIFTLHSNKIDHDEYSKNERYKV